MKTDGFVVSCWTHALLQFTTLILQNWTPQTSKRRWCENCEFSYHGNPWNLFFTETLVLICLSGSLSSKVTVWEKDLFMSVGKMIQAISLALGPEGGAGCIEVSGRSMQKHTLKPNLSTCMSLWLLMKKCLQKMKEYTSESRLWTDLSSTDVWQGW